MKHFYLLFLFITSIAFGQLTPPPELQSYYSDVDFSLIEMQLFNDLAIETATKHTNYISYTPGVWEASKITDEDPSNNNNVLLIYGYNDSDGNYVTDRTRSKNNNGGNPGTDWNREHTFPNSLAQPSLNDNGTNVPPYADAHNLRPSDVTMNGNRQNRTFAAGSGNANTVGSDSWYPGDEWKGDAARIIMYMYLRYGTQCRPSYTAIGTENTIDSNMIDLLLQWNAEDPVSAFEDNRNAYHDSNGTYAQGNRNPFIDNPYIATVIWGGPAAENRWSTDMEAPTAPTNLMATNPTTNSIDLSWTASTDNVGVVSYDIYQDGTNIYNTSATTYTVSGLNADTNYCFTVYANDAAGNTSPASNQDCESTTMSGTGGMADLFISEYVEGGGTNKALEIANFTGASVDLSEYTLKLASNSNNFSTTYSFPVGTIANGDVFVVANTGLLAACQSQQDDINNSITGFNGNDAIGLFKNNVLIDILGVEASGNQFGQNVTLIRKPTIEFPTTTYDANEWNEEAQDDCSNLGQHSQTLSTEETTETKEVSFFPNPVKGNMVNFNNDSNLIIEVYNVLGKKVIKKYVDRSFYGLDISSLNRGVYFIKIKSETGTTTKKLIRQ